MVDEVSLQTFVRKQDINLEDIHYTIHLLSDLSETNGLISLLSSLSRLVAGSREGHLECLSGRDLLDSLHQEINLSEILEEYNNNKLWKGHLEEKIHQAKTESLPANFLEKLLEILAFEDLLYHHGSPFNSRLLLRGKGLTLYHVRDLRNISIPAIVIDGTINEVIAQNVFGNEVLIYNPTMKTEAELIQVVDAGYGKGSLMTDRSGTRDRLLQIVDKLSDGKTVSCSVKPFVKRFFKEDSFYYWAQRGTNEYSGYDRVVLVGGANPNPQELIWDVRALYYLDDYVSDAGGYSWVRHNYMEPRGGGIEVRRYVYEDERFQSWIDSLSSAEMVQAIHRIRPMLDSNKQIYVLSNIPLIQLQPTRLLQLEELEAELGINESNKVAIRNTVVEAVQLRGRITRIELLESCREKCSPKTVDRIMKDLQDELFLAEGKHGREKYWLSKKVG